MNNPTVILLLVFVCLFLAFYQQKMPKTRFQSLAALSLGSMAIVIAVIIGWVWKIIGQTGLLDAIFGDIYALALMIAGVGAVLRGIIGIVLWKINTGRRKRAEKRDGKADIAVNAQ